MMVVPYFSVGESAPEGSGWVNGTGLDDVVLTDKTCFKTACSRAAKGYAAVVFTAHGSSPAERILVYFCSVKEHDEAGRLEADRLGTEAKDRRKAERLARRLGQSQPTEPEGTLLSWVKKDRAAQAEAEPDDLMARIEELTG